MKLDPQFWYDEALKRVFDAANEFEVLERLGGVRLPVAIPTAADWTAPLVSWATRFA